MLKETSGEEPKVEVAEEEAAVNGTGDFRDGWGVGVSGMRKLSDLGKGEGSATKETRAVLWLALLKLLARSRRMV